jgi:hypothetical protein
VTNGNYHRLASILDSGTLAAACRGTAIRPAVIDSPLKSALQRIRQFIERRARH